MRARTLTLLIALFVGLVASLAVAARGRVAVWLLAALEAETGGRVGVGQVGVGGISDLPHLTVTFDDLTLTGVGAHAGLRVFSADRAAVRVSAASLLGPGPLVVTGLVLEQPRLHLSVDSAGRPSWSRTAAPALDLERSVTVALYDLSVTGLTLLYQHQRLVTRLDVGGLEHEAVGRSAGGVARLRTRTRISRLDLTDGGYRVLDDSAWDIDLDLEVDRLTGAASLRPAHIAVNGRPVELRGGARRDPSDGSLELDLVVLLPARESPAAAERSELAAAVRSDGAVVLSVQGSLLRPRIRLTLPP